MAGADYVIEVDFEALGSAAKTLKAQAAVLDDEMKDLGAKLQAMKETWKGKAADAANACETELRGDIVAINRLIEEFGVAVDRARVKLEHVEASNTGLFPSGR